MNNDNDANFPELLSEQLRESLSALVDGELSTTEAAFLIKRMAHDTELNAQWQRFQGIGEVLRGQAQVLDSDNFSARVLSKIAIAQAGSVDTDSVNTDSVNAGQKTASAHLATHSRFSRRSMSRFGAGIAIAAAVAWAALLLPQRFQPEIAPQATAQTAAPLTLASPVVSMRTVSGHIGAGVGAGADQNNVLLAQSMDAFLLEHVQRSPISPISDAVYLPSLVFSDTAETNLAPQ